MALRVLSSCRRERAAVVDLAAGALANDARARLEQHLAGCDVCRAAHAALVEIPAHLRDKTPSRDAAHWSRQRDAIMAAVRALPAAEAVPSWRESGRRWWPAAVVAAAASGALTLWMSSGRHAATEHAIAGAAAVAALDDATLLAVLEVVGAGPAAGDTGLAIAGAAELSEQELLDVADLLGDG